MNQFANSRGEDFGLVIDTSGEKVWLAVVRGQEIIGERRWENGPGVGKVLLEMVEDLLEEGKTGWEKVRRIGIKVTGQRLFSSLRAGVTVANMLGYAKGVELVELDEGDEASIRGVFWEKKTVLTARVRY